MSLHTVIVLPFDLSFKAVIGQMKFNEEMLLEMVLGIIESVQELSLESDKQDSDLGTLARIEAE